jgi:DUF2911 family protein
MRVKTAAALAVAAVSVTAGMVLAQPPRAQRETATVAFDGRKVAIEYGRPALRGRTVDALTAQLPADRIWRAGENQVTTLTTDTDLMVGDKRVPAGKYSVYVHAPAQGNWSLVLNSDPGVPLKQIYAAAPPEVADALWPRLDGYDKVKGTEVARIPLAAANPSTPAEHFVIRFEPAKGGTSSALTLLWGDRGWTTTVKPAR